MGVDLKRLIGAKVRIARTHKHMTQEETAELIGRTTESVSNIERGRTLPTIETLGRLAKALDVPLRDFFDDSFQQSTRSTAGIELELQVQQLVRDLNDEDLAVAVEQIRALAARKRRR
jgi:transcriptional regulator with XRE-family HTH domain